MSVNRQGCKGTDLLTLRRLFAVLLVVTAVGISQAVLRAQSERLHVDGLIAPVEVVLSLIHI